MKDEAIKKINKVGSVSSVIVTILKVLAAVMVAACLLASIIFFFIPKNAMTFEMADDMKMTFNLNEVSGGEKLFDSEADREKFKEEFKGSMLRSSKGDYDIQSIDFTDSDTFVVDAKISSYSVDFTKFQILMVICSIFFVAVFVTLMFVGRFCKQIKLCDTPFAEPVIRSMRHMAISLIPYVISDCIMNSITNSFLTNKASFNFDINVGMLAAVVLIFVMTFVFKYGAKLQQESDETL